MNIIFRESFKKSYFITISQIVKNDGCCHTEFGLLKCAYWEENKEGSFCRLFTKNIIEGNSIHVCDVIYGLTYFGDP